MSLPRGVIRSQALRRWAPGGFFEGGTSLLAALLLAGTFLLGGTLLLFFQGCDDGGTGTDSDLAGGVLASFDVEGEVFRIWVTNPATILQLYDLQAGTSAANIPNGPLRTGPGRGAHNLPWSWHMDPAETEMAENTIEVCDGLPSYVEENLQEWLSLGRYCPWAAQLLDLEDYRQD
ncbi:MAG: hypothetical protein R6T96_16835 [Longimicrobiales bacterium]